MSTVVDLSFKVQGETLPSLHGYALYSALSKVQPALHEADWLGVHTFHGERLGEGLIRLPPRSRLMLRLPAEHIAIALPLAGKELSVGGHRLLVGVPEIRPLVYAASLSARMVTIKGFLEPEPLREAVERQLLALDVSGEVEVGPRLVQPIGEKLVVGFAMRVHGLTESGSIRLQEQGVGGRRRMGCGLFRPSLVSPPGERT